MIMSNEIILRSVYGKVNKKYYINPCPDPRTGRLPQCVRLVDSNGDMILSEDDRKKMNSGTAHFVPANHVFIIEDGTRFDISDVVDRANWEAIENCNWIAKNRSERDASGNLVIDGDSRKYGAADLYVEYPGQITKVKVDKKAVVFKALSYIYEDSEADRIKKAKVLGRNLSVAYPADVLDFLIETAEKEPKKIIDLYEGEDWKMHLFLLDAIERNVISKKDGIYRYDDKMLGGSIEACITFLKDIRFNKLLSSIKMETYPELRPDEDITKIQQESLSGLNIKTGKNK